MSKKEKYSNTDNNSKQSIEIKINKDQFLSSNTYKNKTDVINAVMANNEKLTIQELNNRINDFMKGKVE